MFMTPTNLKNDFFNWVLLSGVNDMVGIFAQKSAKLSEKKARNWQTVLASYSTLSKWTRTDTRKNLSSTPALWVRVE